MRKSYSRRGFIKWLRGMPLDNKVTSSSLCPIAVYMGWDHENHPVPNIGAMQLDRELAEAIDFGTMSWEKFTARDILNVALELSL